MEEHEKTVFRGEAGRVETGALISTVLLLGIFLYDQLFYGMNMWFAILPLLAIGICLLLFGVFPEKYCFTKTTLEVRYLFYRVDSIAYDAVFNLEMTGRDGFVNLLKENKVKVYHTVGKKKKMTVCKPCDVYAFTEELKKRCPEFENEEGKTRLEVFFNK
ncbi:MAG: hypothetical protein IJO67_06795 [Clostridia bacterium]|nr:hypothetical protein [Clostridia bacterium]